jgi:DUF4097 and DUF4098 domain-containing protein YvlB
MRSEEKLNELFKTLREENVTTSVSDVSSWINAYSTSANIKTVKKTAITKKIIIMSAIITTAIIGSIILFSGEQSTKQDKINSPLMKKLPLDSSIKKIIETKQDSIKVAKNQYTSITTFNYLMRDSTQGVEEKNTTEAKLNSNINMNETDPQSKTPKVSKNWRTFNDSLNIDTLFNGVKSLVFTGDNCDLSIRGSKRTDIRMNYHYLLKANGIFLRKKNSELSYELKDSVLTVHLEIKNQIFIGVSLTSETSKLEFNVPENIAVSINTSYGDVALNNLSNNNNNYLIKTLSGNIKMESVNGNVTLSSGSGDVSLKNAELNNLGNNNYRIQTTSGDIKMESVNGNITLNSFSGDVSIKNAELNNLGNNIYHIQTTSGDIITESVNGNVTLSSVSGDVSLKNAELNNLGNNIYRIQTTSGDIKTEQVNGNINLSSISGDVSLKNVLGKINISVSNGDVRGNNISVLESLEITCSNGDVYCMITNPTSELMFSLFSAVGDINIQRQDLSFRGEGRYNFGKGSIKITAKSSSGNIIIR